MQKPPEQAQVPFAKDSTSGPAAMDESLFEPGSVIRRVEGEAFPLLGGGRALLLQLAHPLIAAGVAEHGSFQEDPLGRLLGTLRFVHTIVFGTRREAERAAEWLARIHTPVRGRTTEPTEHFPAGTTYSANDPQLGLWVFATLIDSGLDSYERFVARLSRDERESYYDQARRMAHLLQIPGSLVPPTLASFYEYLNGMIESGPIEVTSQARSLADEVLHPNLRGLPALSAVLLRFVTAGTLPESLRRDYRLPWDRRRQLLLDGVSRVTRALRPWMPRWIWQGPLLGPGLARLLLGGLEDFPPETSPSAGGQPSG